MIDSIVILTPVLVLGVLLLLGFVGCAVIGDPPGPAHFYIRVNVPLAYLVTSIEYAYVRPSSPDGGSSGETIPNPSAWRTVDDHRIFRYDCGPGVSGEWSVGCAVRASEGGFTQDARSPEDPAAPAPLSPDNPAQLEGTEQNPIARFEAGGSPSQLQFRVEYFGVEDL